MCTAQPPRRISAASTKSWLMMWPPNGLRPCSSGSPACLGEGARADQRVVAPVVALRAVPPGDAMRDQRAVDAAGELLHAGEQRRAAGDDRQRLDQPDIGVAFHRADQPHQRFASHQAVGVEDQELGIGGAEPPHPFGDVARFARGVVRAPAIEDTPLTSGAFAQHQETPPPRRSRFQGRWCR